MHSNPVISRLLSITTKQCESTLKTREKVYFVTISRDRGNPFGYRFVVRRKMTYIVLNGKLLPSNSDYTKTIHKNDFNVMRTCLNDVRGDTAIISKTSNFQTSMVFFFRIFLNPPIHPSIRLPV